MTNVAVSDSGPHSSNSAGARPAAAFDGKDAALIAVLLACLAGMFWRVLFASDMFFFRDVFNYTYPHARFIQELCRQGQLPYWNPYLNYGNPVLANPNLLFFYPTTVLLVLLPIDFGYTLHYILHFALAGMGTYCLARQWQQSRTAAFFAAFVFTFSGPVLSLGNFYNHVAAAAWIPWALLLADRALESRSWRPWIGLTLVFALQFLAAELFTLLATFVLAFAYAWYRSGDLRSLWARANLRLGACYAAVGFLAVGLAGAQLFPALDLLRNSRRGTQGLPFEETAYWSFHPFSLIEMVVPDFYGTSLDAPSLWTWALSTPHLAYFPSIFVGFVPLFFALAGWALARHRRREFLAAAALILLLLAFGKYTPVFALAYLVNPLLSLVRFPVKLLTPIVLLVALLAGWGYDALRAGAPTSAERRRRILVPLLSLGMGSACLWMLTWVAPRVITAPASGVILGLDYKLQPEQVDDALQFFVTMLRVHLPGLVGFSLAGIAWIISRERGKKWASQIPLPVAWLGMVQLVAVNYAANPTVPKSFYTYRPPVLEYFQNSEQPYRYSFLLRLPPSAAAASSQPDATGFLNFDSIPEAANLSYLAQAAFRDRLLLARGAMLTKVEGSLNFDIERSQPPLLYDFWTFALRQLPTPAQIDCLLGRTNVRYQILKTPQPNSTLREIAPVFNGSAFPSALYENCCALPRAYVVGRASFEPSSMLTLARLADPGFDAAQEVILNTGPVETPDSAPSGSPGTVEFLDRQANTVTLEAELSHPGYVVLLDRFDPNWHAVVDGREVPVLRANHMFRAVHVPAGRHHIRFEYRQNGLLLGLAVSAATALLLLALYTLNPKSFWDPSSRRISGFAGESLSLT
jgi:hypothetical protein